MISCYMMPVPDTGRNETLASLFEAAAAYELFDKVTVFHNNAIV